MYVMLITNKFWCWSLPSTFCIDRILRVAHKDQIRLLNNHFIGYFSAIKLYGLLPNHSPNPRYSRYIFYPNRSTTSLKMQGDLYPCEVVVLVLTNANTTFLETILGNHCFSRYLRLWFRFDWETKISMFQVFEKKIQKNCCLF